MNNAVDEFFTVHAPCKAAVQVLKKLMTVLKCLLKDLFKGEIGSFRAAGIGVPRLFVSVHIIMFIRQIILIDLLLLSGEDWQSAFNPGISANDKNGCSGANECSDAAYCGRLY